MPAWDIPMYSPLTASRLVGLSRDRVRRWLRGYKYTYSVKSEDKMRTGQKSPVFSRTNKNEIYASFLELIDLLLVKEFISYGFSLQKIRRALSESEEILGERHFAKKIFFTDGREIYLRIKNKNNANTLLQLLSGGQWVIKSIIEQTSHQIVFDRDTDYAKRWYPLGPNGLVVLDPQISFGVPTIAGRGIPTSAIYDLYVAEGENLDPVCSWMELNKNEAQTAVRFELRHAA